VVRSRSQPIALDDVLEYLVRLPDIAEAAGAIYDAGGPEVLTYAQMMREFGTLVGRRPLIVPVPVLTPQLSSYWLNLVTAVPTNVARALIEGLEHDVLADGAAIRALVPLPLKTYGEAARAALAAERAGAATPRWTEGSMLYRQNRPDFAFYAKQMYGEAIARRTGRRRVARSGGHRRRERLLLSRQRVARARCVDELAGGVGLRRGRRDPQDVAVGDTIDFWRVVAVEPGRRLTLLAEMKLPGSAALDLEVRPEGPGPHADRRHRVFPSCRGTGLLYWHALTPAHVVIYRGLAKAIAERPNGASPPFSPPRRPASLERRPGASASVRPGAPDDGHRPRIAGRRGRGAIGHAVRSRLPARTRRSHAFRASSSTHISAALASASSQTSAPMVPCRTASCRPRCRG